MAFVSIPAAAENTDVEKIEEILLNYIKKNPSKFTWVLRC